MKTILPLLLLVLSISLHLAVGILVVYYGGYPNFSDISSRDIVLHLCELYVLYRLYVSISSSIRFYRLISISKSMIDDAKDEVEKSDIIKLVNDVASKFNT